MSARRGVALVLFLLFLAVMASAAGLMVVAIMFSGPPAPKVSSNSTLFLRVQAPFPEIESISVLSPFVTAPPTLRTVVAAIDKARHDDRIRGMVVIPNTGGAMWAQLQELHEAMAAFRTSGKSLVVFMEYGGSGDYYLASAAERVLMMPAGTLDVSGLATYELFFRGALDKLGVYPDLLHMGEFKSYSNTFTEKGFTPAHREMTRSLNRDAYDQLVAAIAKGRNKSVDEIRRLIDEGPFLPEEAKAAGLIDDVAYDDQIDDASPVQGTRRLESADYLRGFEAGVGTGPRIALLYAVGTIASGNSTFDAPGGTVLGSDTFVDWIRKVRADSSIRAIVIRIDSPGGSAIASEVIWRELMLTRQVKPVIVSMGDVAASGGYYMAVPANAIVAEPGTITGSIGVVTGKFVLKGTMDKLGVGTDSVSDGKNAEIYSPFRPFTPPERAKMEAQMQSTYELFVSRVAEGRRSSSEKIDAIAKGRVWTGKQARELGLVDELGGLDRAIALAKEHAKLDISKPVTLVVYPQKRSVFELFANPLGVGLGTSLEILTNRPEARVLDRMAERLRLFRRGETLALMPNLFYTGALTPVERFPLTHQSVLERIRSGDATVRHGAFSDLITGYWRPSYHYLRLHWRLPADEAEDVIQGFFTVAFEKGYLEKFDPAKARFRTFLRTCLDRFLQNQRKAETALKRGGSTEILSLDFPGAELEMSLVSTDLRDLDQFFRDEIIRALFARAVDELRDAFTQEGKARAFEAFERHDLSDDEGRSYGNVASAMGVPVTTVTNDLHTARTRFREIALVHLRALVGSDEEYRQEARQLFGVEVALD